MNRLSMCLAALVLAGCAAPPPRVEIQRVNVPIPVACREPAPERPAMPTEALRPGGTMDDFARAAMAEIERREGYEGQLLTALESCRKPVSAETGEETMRKLLQHP
jgi:hypothetical protein